MANASKAITIDIWMHLKCWVQSKLLSQVKVTEIETFDLLSSILLLLYWNLSLNIHISNECNKHLNRYFVGICMFTTKISTNKVSDLRLSIGKHQSINKR